MKQGSPLRQLVAASIGAVITSILQLLFLLRQGQPVQVDGADWIALALAAITGAIIGWGYQLATGLQSALIQALDRLETVSEEATKRLKAATNRLEYTEEPLKMLDTASTHAATIGLLWRDSLKEGFRFISYANENQYFGYLKSAIRESHRYEGIQRRPVRAGLEATNATPSHTCACYRRRRWRPRSGYS
jgi:hypothetical protein